MKIKIFILSLISSSLFAQTSLDAHFNLFSYDQHGKVQVIKDVKVSKSQIIVDGAPLSQTENLIKAKFLRKLVTAKSELKEINCPMGNFIFRKSINGKDSIENGCLDTKRFNELNTIFNQFKKDLVLK